MKKPNPPPQLPTEKESRDSFQRWLYNLWEYVLSLSADGDQGMIAARVFDRATQPVLNRTDSETILVARSFGSFPQQPAIGLDAQRILEGQIFGG